ncbi:MAG: HlyD family efflux transporter periplasmic adaptor subunit [Thiotrichales bacterium]
MSVAIIQQWLGMQCRNIPGARSGVITLQNADDGMTSVQWPASQAPLPSRLLKAAKTATEQHKAFVHIPRNNADEKAGTVLAMPLRINGLPDSAAALDCDKLNPDEGKAALELLARQLPRLEQLLNPARVDKTEAKPPLDLLTRTLATGLTHPDFDTAITAVTTELQQRFGCERISFAFWKNQTAQIHQVSGTSEIKRQQKLLRDIENVMNEAADQMMLVCSPATEKTVHRINLAHRDYASQHNDAVIASAPLINNEELFGILCFERAAGRNFSDQELDQLETVAAFLAPLFQLKYDASAPWYRRLFKAPDDNKRLITRKKVLLFSAITAVILLSFSAFWPVSFEVTAPARIEGSVQRTVTAPGSGYLDQVFVRPGDFVTRGDLLATLDDDDLLVERRRLESELSQFQSDYSAAMATRNRAEMGVATAKINEAQAKLDLVKQQLKRLDLRANLSGIVIAGDLTQSLGSPVEKGQELMTLAPDKDYRIKLGIPEADIRHVSVGQSGELVLASSPGKKIPFEITRITPMASILDNQNTFAAEAQINDQQQHQLRPGMEGYARIHAGERSLLWVWMHRIGDWLRLQTWKWTGSL